jgi:D-serine deaminase-like pyridoxal phosphate-dependent protein
MTIHELDTPTLLIDRNVLDRNLRKMSKYCDDHKLKLRPHTKTHKIPEIARLQVQYGAGGITVAKLGEAEVMADAGIEDILIVYPLWGEKKWPRLVDLAARVRITVAVDSLVVAAGISQAATAAGVKIGIRAEFDTGFHRCGWPITAASMDEIQKMIALPGLRWDGILVYPGHIMGNRTIREQDIERENVIMDALFELLDSSSIPYPAVSGGNTPAAFASHRFHGLTEIRPGTYVFNDRNTVEAESAEFANCALAVLVTVVSTSGWQRALIDSGSKTLSADPLLSGDRLGYGYVVGHPEFKLGELSEEHGHLTIPGSSTIKIGDRLRIIPNHVCTCINLHDRVFVVEGEHVVNQWKVAARGKVA